MQAYTYRALTDLRSRIFTLPPGDKKAFQALALDVFHFQAAHNLIYRTYLANLGTRVEEIAQLEEIPFLPLSFFRTHAVKTGVWTPQLIFQSSGTTDPVRSKHFLDDPRVYDRLTQHIFLQHYGIPRDDMPYATPQAHILALLPAYLERGDSSLVYMVQALMACVGSPHSGFFLHQEEALFERIEALKGKEGLKILFGIRAALLDLAEKGLPDLLDLSDFVLMETGGMKQKGEIWTPADLHRHLKERLRPRAVHAEYGMTELLSHAYAAQEAIFQPPPWLLVKARAIDDPFVYVPHGQLGALNIVDLASVHACSFLETEDLGKTWSSGHFEVLGRMEGAVPRGCHSLMET